MSATGDVAASTTAAVCPSIRVTVSVEKSGSLRSGQANGTPRAASSLPNLVAFDEAGEDAKPWR